MTIIVIDGNIGSGKSYTIEKIFYTVKKIIKSDVIPKWSTMRNRSWDQEIWVSDMNLVRKKLNWKYSTNLNLGLKKTYLWMLKNTHLYS